MRVSNSAKTHRNAAPPGSSSDFLPVVLFETCMFFYNLLKAPGKKCPQFGADGFGMQRPGLRLTTQTFKKQHVRYPECNEKSDAHGSMRSRFVYFPGLGR
jgi:hypothetical protein